MRIETKDEIVQAVLHKMDQRSLIGQKKYGATMMQEIVGQEKDLNRFLIDVQEELMDALLYIEAAKRCLADEVEEVMLNRINVEYDKVSPCSAHAFEEDDERMNIIAQNGNTGEHYEKTL
tara:strand:- start:265 stop:624 length:360 start_codon:yes stop_codon:yes gene_type:complete